MKDLILLFTILFLSVSAWSQNFISVVNSQPSSEIGLTTSSPDQYTQSQYSLQDSCEISHITVSDISCSSDTTYWVTINFEYIHVTDSVFDLHLRDGLFSSHHYNELPITVELTVDPNPHQYIKIIDPHSPDCYAEKEFGVECGQSGDCKILELEANHIECSSDSTYFVTIDFINQHTSDSFDLHIRSGVFGTFAYTDLPLTLELPVEPFSHQLIKVVDSDDPHCFKAIEPVVECGQSGDCKILELEANHIECSSDSTYFVTIDFFHEHTSDSFDLHIRSGVFGTFAYSDLPLTLELPVEPFSHQLIKVVDSDDPHCFKAIEFGVECGQSGDCKILELEANHIECSSDSTYFVTIDFINQHTSDSFDLHIRSGVFGTFAYSDLPLTVELPVEPFPHQLIKVYDGYDPHCFKAIEFGVECGQSGDCKILELEANHIECSSDSTYFVTIDFINQHTSDSFDLHIRSGVFGTFAYTDLPLTVELSVEPFSHQLIKVVDSDDPHCFKAIEFGVECGEPSDCKILELEANHIECSSDSTYFVTIDFINQHTSDSFDLHIRSGVFGTFAYTDLPLTLELPVEPFSHQLIKVVDSDDPHCFKAIEFGVECGQSGDCKILELEANHIECSSDSTYFVIIDFINQHTSDSFDLHIRSGVFGTFAYRDLPLTLELPVEPFSHQLIKVVDSDDPHCFKAIEFFVDCHPSSISENGLKDMKVYPNPVSNQINIQTASRGSYEYLIYDSQGRLMQKGRVSTDHSIEIGNWPSGPYFLHLRDEHAHQVHIIIKQ